jgi:hypothetical protein
MKAYEIGMQEGLQSLQFVETSGQWARRADRCTGRTADRQPGQFLDDLGKKT